ncbi:MAG: glycosyltransferase [Luteolibacter sp.]|uniref:glycosyltransferase n=1 Tax=Luteolibacter sp. TaxID=1962973 RepID=UPI003267BDD4
MRILHWAPQFGTETGTGKAIQGWLRALSSRGLSCTVISLPLEIQPEPNLKVLQGPGLWTRLRLFGEEIKTANIVHLHGAFDIKLCAVHLIIALEKIWRMTTGEPLHIVITPHGALSSHVFSTKTHRKTIYWNFVERLLAKQTSLAICTTPMEAQELEGLLPKMRIGVVPLVLPDSKGASFPRVKTVAGRVPTLCTLGRYDIHTKGLDLLIDAVLKLNSEGFPVRLRCIGYDQNGGTKELEDQVRSMNAGDFVECAGPRFGEEKLRMLAECDAFCMPSRYESFSYALMEGLESGLPVLVGSGACLTSFFDESQRRSMVVEPDANTWAAAIQNLLKSPAENIKCAERTLRELRAKCSASVVGESLAMLYHATWMVAEKSATSATTPIPSPPVANPTGVASPPVHSQTSASPPTIAQNHESPCPVQENPLETAMASDGSPDESPQLAPGPLDLPSQERLGGPNLLSKVLGTSNRKMDGGAPPGGRLFL